MKDLLKKLFLENVGLKLLSIVLAVLGWCVIMNSADPTVSVTIKNINVTKLNEDSVTGKDMIYDVVSGDVISITVSGPRSVVQSLTNSDIYATVNLQEIGIFNTCPIHVSFHNSNVAKSVSVTSKSDEVMVLSLETMITENKQVQVELVGTAVDGYYAQAEALPNMIAVYGSETQVQNIEKFIAEIDITGKSTSYETSTDVYAVDKQGERLDGSKFTVGVTRVDAKVTLYRTKNINIIIEDELSAEYGFAYKPIEQAPSTITIAGPNDIINSVTDIVIPYKQENLKETVTDSLSLTEHIPEGCYLVSDTEFVSVTIPVVRLDEEKSFTTTINNLGIQNLKTGLTISNLDAQFTFSIWGAEGETESINLKDLGLYVDMKNITEAGTYNVGVSMNTELQVNIEDELQVKITVVPTATTATTTTVTN